MVIKIKRVSEIKMIAETILIIQSLLICGFIYNTLRINELTDLQYELSWVQRRMNDIMKDHIIKEKKQ